MAWQDNLKVGDTVAIRCRGYNENYRRATIEKLSKLYVWAGCSKFHRQTGYVVGNKSSARCAERYAEPLDSVLRSAEWRAVANALVKRTSTVYSMSDFSIEQIRGALLALGIEPEEAK